MNDTQSIYDFQVTTIDNIEMSLENFSGHALLIVNVASKCGFTGQYKGLQELYLKYKDKGFTILGFPCNQFGAQEPGDEEEIKGFCELNYGVSFPMFAKVNVNGDDAHPLYKYLKHKSPGLLGTEGIKWNFTKFLINKKGEVVDRYAPSTSPEKLSGDIEACLIS